MSYTPMPPLGQTGMAGSLPVVIASDDKVATTTFDGSGSAINSVSAGTGQNGLMVALGATNYVSSANNSSTAQLSAGATFTGVIESIFNQPSVSLLLTSDQPGVLTLFQYIDAGGTRIADSWAFPVTAGVPFCRSFTINGNFFNLTFTNTGTQTTTTLNINAAYGIIENVDGLGNLAVGIGGVGGAALVLGQAQAAASLPVVMASNQTPIPHIDAGNGEGQINELMSQILMELKIANIQRAEMLRLLGPPGAQADDPAIYRADPSIFRV